MTNNGNIGERLLHTDYSKRANLYEHKPFLPIFWKPVHERCRSSDDSGPGSEKNIRSFKFQKFSLLFVDLPRPRVGYSSAAIQSLTGSIAFNHSLWFLRGLLSCDGLFLKFLIRNLTTYQTSFPSSPFDPQSRIEPTALIIL